MIEVISHNSTITKMKSYHFEMKFLRTNFLLLRAKQQLSAAATTG